jgi:hypothetical protein
MINGALRLMSVSLEERFACGKKQKMEVDGIRQEAHGPWSSTLMCNSNSKLINSPS